MLKPNKKEQAFIKWCDDQPAYLRPAAHRLRIARKAYQYLNRAGKPLGAASREYIRARDEYLHLLGDQDSLFIPGEPI